MRICVPLGALYDEAVACLREAGVDTAPLDEAGRRLVVDGPGGTRFITTRPSDVPTYVESGAADVGMVGKDVLREQEPDVYEVLDLGFGRCRMIYATQARTRRPPRSSTSGRSASPPSTPARPRSTSRPPAGRPRWCGCRARWSWRRSSASLTASST
jgi:ATP phosphoribosyltransferase